MKVKFFLSLSFILILSCASNQQNMAFEKVNDNRLQIHRDKKKLILLKKDFRQISQLIDQEYLNKNQEIISAFDEKIKKVQNASQIIFPSPDSFESQKEYEEKVNKFYKEQEKFNKILENQKQDIQKQREYEIAKNKLNIIIEKKKRLKGCYDKIMRIKEKQYYLPKEKILILYSFPNAEEKFIPITVIYNKSLSEKKWHYKAEEKDIIKNIWEDKDAIKIKGVFAISCINDEECPFVLDNIELEHPKLAKNVKIQIRQDSSYYETSFFEKLDEAIAQYEKTLHNFSTSLSPQISNQKFIKINNKGQFVNDNTFSCVKDKETGLIWEAQSKLFNEAFTETKTRLDFYEALSLEKKIKDVEICGCSKWRLPEVSEFQTLISKEKEKKINSNFFPEIKANSDFWLNKEVKKHHAQFFSFSTKKAHNTYAQKNKRVIFVCKEKL